MEKHKVHINIGETKVEYDERDKDTVKNLRKILREIEEQTEEIRPANYREDV